MVTRASQILFKNSPKNSLICENAFAYIYYGSCRLLVKRSLPRVGAWGQRRQDHTADRSQMATRRPFFQWLLPLLRQGWASLLSRLQAQHVPSNTGTHLLTPNGWKAKWTLERMNWDSKNVQRWDTVRERYPLDEFNKQNKITFVLVPSPQQKSKNNVGHHEKADNS